MPKGEKHTHDWMLGKGNVPFRDGYGKEYVVSFYVCECGATGKVTTPRELFNKGFETLGIEETS